MIHRCRSCEVRCERSGSLSLILGIVQASIHLSSSSPPSLLLLSPSSLPPLFLSSHDGFRSWSTHTHTHTEFRYEVREAREGERERRGEERRGEERRGEERRGEERRGEERRGEERRGEERRGEERRGEERRGEERRGEERKGVTYVFSFLFFCSQVNPFMQVVSTSTPSISCWVEQIDRRLHHRERRM